MRRVSVLLVAFLVPGVVSAKPQSRYITVSEVEVRGGPSDRFGVTGKLRQNDTVQIKERVNNGTFLEIVPPLGSVSWINAEEVSTGASENGRQILIVKADDTKIRVGGPGATGPLNVFAQSSINGKLQPLTLTRGSKLVQAGLKTMVDGVTWLAVDATLEESRFIPASAIEARTAANDAPTLPRGHANSAKEPPQWALAEQALRDGRLDQAERLFFEIVREYSAGGEHFDLSLRAQNRLNEIRLRRRSMLTSRPEALATIPSVGAPMSAVPRPAIPPRPPVHFPSQEMPRMGGPPRLAGQWESSVGWLRRSGFQIDGRQTYALESSQGQLRVYVTAEPGVDLETHLNRAVEIIGRFETRGDVRGALYMRAARVIPWR